MGIASVLAWLAATASPPSVAIDVHTTPATVALGEGAVWATAPYGAEGRVMHIDPARNQVAASIPTPGSPSAIAAGLGAVWVTGTYVRRGDVLHRIDPAANRVVASLSLPGRFAGQVALGMGSVWVVVSDRRRTLLSLVQVDPATSQVVRTTPVARRWAADQLIVRAGSAWLLTRAGEVLRYDLDKGRLVARVDAHARGMALGPRGLWIATTGSAQRIDMRTNEPVSPGVALPGAKLAPLFVGRRRVWLGGHDEQDRSVAYRLDTRSARIDRFIRLRSGLHLGMTFDPSRHALWLARVSSDVLRVDLAGRRGREAHQRRGARGWVER
jgi:hypothetical protein